MLLNQWIEELMDWDPAQLYYFFKDNSDGHWCIYLRWDGQRGDEPWESELIRCDENWDFRWDSPDTISLLKEKDHVPGTVVGYYYDKEYPYLQQRILEIMKDRFPDLEFPNNK